MSEEQGGDQEELGETAAANDDGDEQPEAAEDQQQQQQRVPPPPPIASKKASAKEDDAKKKRGRPSGKIGRIPEGVGNPHEADLLWPDVIERIHGEGLNTYEMIIRVARASPGPYQMLGSIEASSVEGGGEHDGFPGDLLRNAIIDTFHLSQPGPAVYDVCFCWKRGATIYDRGKLPLPSMREIELIRNAQYRQGQAAEPPSPAYPQPQPRAPQGMGAPPAPYQQQAPQYPYPQHVPQPPQVQPQSHDGALVELIREMRADQARLAQRVEQIAAGQHAPAPPVAPQGLGADAIEAIHSFAKAAEALKPFGVSFAGPGIPHVQAPAPAQQVHVPPPPPAPKPEPPKSDEEILIAAIKGLEEQKKLARRAAEALGITLPDENAAPDDDEPEEKEDKGPGLGFIPMPIPNAHWPDGSPMQHATDADGNWDIGGIVMSNPYIISTFGGHALKIVERLMAQKGLGSGQPTEPEQTPPQQEANGAQRPWKL
jgi:hypothetical protein